MLGENLGPEQLTQTPIEAEAGTNFEAFKKMTYPGRFIVSGLSDMGQMVQVYGIMGRSPTSRGRYFQMNREGVVDARPIDPTKPVDPLTLYSAMREQDGVHIVSNGTQTNTIMWAAASMIPFDLSDALEERTFEPDPSHTPRISAISDNGRIQFSILREDPQNSGQLQEPKSFPPVDDLTPGVGFEVQTYTGGGDTASYVGEPIPFPLKGTINDIADVYWEALNDDNKVSLAVKVIDVQSGEYQIMIKNKYAPLEAETKDVSPKTL